MSGIKSGGLLNNSRFYILAFSLLLSLAIFAFTRLSIESDQLVAIRTQQLYGLACIVFWYGALIISPLGHVIGKHRLKHIEFARRAIGVSAFYFAALHSVVALYGQLGGIGQLQYLPNSFITALVLGGLALLILGLMAATSFNRVVKRMTYPKWKLLHRLVYIAGVLALLHVWMIGTHLAYTWIQIGSVVAIGLLLGLELFKLTRNLNRKYFRLSRSEAGALFITAWTLSVVLLVSLPSLVDNYHSRHTSHTEQGVQP